jgi:hypothetical protein
VRLLGSRVASVQEWAAYALRKACSRSSNLQLSQAMIEQAKSHECVPPAAASDHAGREARLPRSAGWYARLARGGRCVLHARACAHSTRFLGR